MKYLACFLLCTPALFAQGPLAPPAGPPAPGMKTLEQIEPRRPLVAGTAGVAVAPSGTITISEAGSYYLTGNMTLNSGNGITITSDDVTLDLGGFTIQGNAGGGFGVSLSGGRTRIAIRNGSIRGNYTYNGTFSGSGFGSGIDYSGSAPTVVRVSDVMVEGVASYGIDLGTGLASVVESCVVRVATITGIRAGVVTDSIALLVGGSPIVADSVHNSIGKKADGNPGVTATQATLNSLSTTVTSVSNAVTALDTSVSASGEKRTALNSFSTIGTSGSYYLSGNITVASGNGLTITASNVSLDLNGFTIRTSAASSTGTAISLSPSANNVTISNGQISGLFFYGVHNPSGSIKNVTVRDLIVQGPTARGIGILGSNRFVENCTVTDVTDTDLLSAGIIGDIVKSCVVRNCGSVGIAAKIVTDCVAEVNVSGTFNSMAIQGETVTSCNAINLGSGRGISSAGVVSNSIGQAVAGEGISAVTAENSKGISSTGYGLQTTGTASGCTGQTNNGTVALDAATANMCRGIRSTGGIAIQAPIAIGCSVSGAGATVSSPSKHLGTP